MDGLYYYPKNNRREFRDLYDDSNKLLNLSVIPDMFLFAAAMLNHFNITNKYKKFCDCL